MPGVKQQDCLLLVIYGVLGWDTAYLKLCLSKLNLSSATHAALFYT